MAQCAVCGHNSDCGEKLLPEAAEPPDFDTRPGEPLRSTLPDWIQRCPNCGYCAPDLSFAQDRVSSIVNSESYQQVLSDPIYPLKAREFLCFASILDRIHQYADAGWSALHAAWVCDDAAAAGPAAACRTQTLELWRRGKPAGQMFSDDMASEFALITDLYRRTGQFEHATIACSEGLDLEDVPPPLESVLRRQMVLIAGRDTESHSMKELLS
jgi:hypothetical protein